MIGHKAGLIHHQEVSDAAPLIQCADARDHRLGTADHDDPFFLQRLERATIPFARASEDRLRLHTRWYVTRRCIELRVAHAAQIPQQLLALRLRPSVGFGGVTQREIRESVRTGFGQTSHSEAVLVVEHASDVVRGERPGLRQVLVCGNAVGPAPSLSALAMHGGGGTDWRLAGPQQALTTCETRQAGLDRAPVRASPSYY